MYWGSVRKTINSRSAMLRMMLFCHWVFVGLLYLQQGAGFEFGRFAKLPLRATQIRKSTLKVPKRVFLHYNLQKLQSKGNDKTHESSYEDKLSVNTISQLRPNDTKSHPLLSGIKSPLKLNGSDVRIGIIMTRSNEMIVSRLIQGVNESLSVWEVNPSHVYSTYVPGLFELPMTAKFLASSKRFDVIVCIGCAIRGEALESDPVVSATALGIMQVALDSFIPIIFGVLVVNSKEDAMQQSSGPGNAGIAWGRSAVEMGLARISAMGFDAERKQSSASQPFVTFNATGILPTVQSNSTDTKRKFGF
jgi:6,7-dimethyl-8-ribityllumazine synthase